MDLFKDSFLFKVLLLLSIYSKGMNKDKAFLIILDGWGYGTDSYADAIAAADTPFFDYLRNDYPHATLTTFGTQVGLPDGQMGNSEVGHLNIGAGRIIYQTLLRINNAVSDGSFFKNQVLSDAFKRAKAENKKIHFIGLLSDGGVHSHINHLKALIQMAESFGCRDNYIHAFTDGRDVDPKSGLSYLYDILDFLEGKLTRIASITGRYYAMDRDNRWERIKVAYDALVKGQGFRTHDLIKAVEESYVEGVTDEFIKPIIRVNDLEKPLARIENGDMVVFFNFRTDRPRELTEVLTMSGKPEYEMEPLDLDYLTLTKYDETFEKVKVVFGKDDLSGTLGEILSQEGKVQLRIAETEKYPHVTFFFNGGREEPFPYESRILVPSPKVSTYDLQPEMSAYKIKEKVIDFMRTVTPDFICLNFANTDMVGHTGDFDAAKLAAEAVDKCLSEIVPVALEYNYHLVIIADHGNSDFMINKDGSPNTAHTVNPVPFILVSKEYKNIKVINGKLADISPTILELLKLRKPEVMTGTSLLKK